MNRNLFKKAGTILSAVVIALCLTGGSAAYAKENTSDTSSDKAAVSEKKTDIKITYPKELKIDEITLNFDIKESVRESENTHLSTELQGVKRFNIFRLYNGNMLLPIETFHDEEAGRVYARTDECGVYCIIDMAAWFDSRKKSENR